MTGVSSYQGSYQDDQLGFTPSMVARPELIMEGLEQDSSEWKEMHFLHKPGDVSTVPTVVAPHQPRLDWQMWFAALGSHSSNPWLIHLVHKLLVQSPDQSSVLYLLDKSRYPFGKKPPKAIRISKYEYDFTRMNTSWARATPFTAIVEFNLFSAVQGLPWYSRSGGQEYLPALEADSPSVSEYLKSQGLEPRRAKRAKTSTQLYDACLKQGAEKAPDLFWIQRPICSAILVRKHLKPYFEF
jgi:hypothetical protein